MEHKYWHQRWAENRIGFHLPDINAHLKDNWPKLGLSGKQRVFVPLCGKTQDLLYLRDLGLDVVGIELNESAVAAFFEENNIKVRKIELAEKQLNLWQAEGIEIYNGDFFQLDRQTLGNCQAVYDRAALVALPRAMRIDYVSHLHSLVPSHAKILLVTLEYDEKAKQGPPFSVTESDVKEYFQDNYNIQLLACHGTPEAQKSDSSQGVEITDKIFLLEPK